MAICGPGSCDCAFVSETLNITRDGNIITIEQAEFSSITELEEAVANILAQLALDPATYVNVTGDTMTGPLRITCAGQQLRLTRTDADGPHVGFYDDDETTREGYIQCGDPTGMVINSEGSDLIRFISDGVDRGRFDGTVFLIGKATTNIGVSGVESRDDGQLWITQTTNVGSFCNKDGAAEVNGGTFFGFRTSNTSIGSITRATGSTTAFNTSSDEDLKMNILPLDDELAEWVARIVEPYLFEYKITPGDVHAGYIAQRVAAMWPQSIDLGIVSPGWGNVEDRTWDEDGNETTPDDVWRGWQMDYSKLLPVVHAAWRSTANKLDALTARVAALEAA